MAVSVNSIPIRVRSLLRSRGQDVSNLRSNQILPLVGDALAVMANRIADGDSYQGLQKDFNATPVAGVIDLTALTGIIFNLARSEVRVASSNVILTAVDSVHPLNSNLSNDQVYYSQEGTDLRFRDTAGSITSYTTAVKIKANYVPTLSELSALSRFDYEAMLISTLAAMLSMEHEPRAMELSTTGGRA